MTREELFDLVWEQPATHLAKRFGLSAAAMRKLCADHLIPMPPPGYWTKRSHGLEIERPPLPQSSRTLLSRLNLALRRISDTSTRFADSQISEFAAAADQGVTIDLDSDVASRIESDVRILADTLSAAPVDDNGFVECHGRRLPSVRVGAATVPRLVAVFSSLLQHAAGQGARPVETDHGLGLSLLGELFIPRFGEGRKRVRYVATAKDIEHAQRNQRAAGDAELKPVRKSWPTWRFVPSGRLALDISDPRPFRWSASNTVGSWQDNRTAPIEARLSGIVSAMNDAVSSIKSARAEHERLQARQSDRKARIQDQAERLARREQRDAFVSDKARAYASYLELVAFSEFLAARLESNREGISSLHAAVLERLSELEQSLDADALDAEISLSGLFDANA